MKSLGTIAAITLAASNAYAAEAESALSISAVINFVLLAGILIYLLRKPVSEFFGKRHDTVKQAVTEAEALRQSVETMVADYQQKLDRLDGDVEEILTAARSRGEQERKRILERAERMADRIRHDAELAAEKERSRLSKKLERETLSEAAARASALLKKRVTEKDHQEFVKELVRRLEGENGAQN